MKNTHRLLVIGLGSMGKRRIRNLAQMGFSKLAGFDPRKDRRDETAEKYKVPVYASLEDAMSAGSYDAFIISVPPDKHHLYMKKAVESGLPFFVEASVVDNDYDALISEISNKKIVAAPSATLYFHPAIKKIYEIVRSQELGTISNVTYHSGQYLPDWHTYEPVSDFYVSSKDTGGAREIVPFELTWITKLFGFPAKVIATVKKTIAIEGAEEIDDTYNLLMDYDKFTFNLVVDVVSRYATRRLLINGSAKQLYWNWDENAIKVYEPASETWTNYTYETAPSQEGYNTNITEQMYMDELKNFIEAVEGSGEFFNTMAYDHKVLKLLYAAEESYRSGCFKKI